MFAGLYLIAFTLFIFGIILSNLVVGSEPREFWARIAGMGLVSIMVITIVYGIKLIIG